MYLSHVHGWNSLRNVLSWSAIKLGEKSTGLCLWLASNAFEVFTCFLDVVLICNSHSHAQAELIWIWWYWHPLPDGHSREVFNDKLHYTVYTTPRRSPTRAILEWPTKLLRKPAWFFLCLASDHQVEIHQILLEGDKCCLHNSAQFTNFGGVIMYVTLTGICQIHVHTFPISLLSIIY